MSNEHGPSVRTILVRKKVRDFMKEHLGCTAKEAARELCLSYDVTNRAFGAIRKEWSGKACSPSSDSEEIERAMAAIERAIENRWPR